MSRQFVVANLLREPEPSAVAQSNGPVVWHSQRVPAQTIGTEWRGSNSHSGKFDAGFRAKNTSSSQFLPIIAGKYYDAHYREALQAAHIGRIYALRATASTAIAYLRVASVGQI